MSVVISIRVEEDVKVEIEKMGYAPGEYIRDLVEKDIKKKRARKALDWLSEHRLPAGGPNAEDLIRMDRDSR